ncbi:MAG: two-component system response regulator CreB [Deltaproteobacteria bacterium RBG_13_61_14]|nr:MAG: two-component system response regulator CreB [Deltaproteobacteria bacterium RBG_13_61_14]
MPTILAIDDDPHIREILEFTLTKAGFKVILARDGKEGIQAFQAHRPDLVILDILMPELDGAEVCKQLRAQSQVPILFLTSVDDEVDRILGLEMGGDDYITKPFSPREVAARVKAVLRRASRPEPASPPRRLCHGSLRLDLDCYKAYWDDTEVPLTVTEFRIVQSLMAHPGKVYSRDELLDLAYAEGTVVTDRTIDSHIKRIRRKFEVAGGDPIATMHGAGYRLAE